MLNTSVNSAYAAAKDDTSGELASYIPKLARVSPDLFGLALVAMDGRVFSVGDVDVPFSIQSVSKPFTFGLALTELGVDEVYKRTGVEPSGDDFNSVVLDETGRPFNPMVNAGAIAMTGLLCTIYGDDTFTYIHEAYNKFAGAELSIDREVFKSELATADRNLAIAHLLHSSGIIGDVDQVVETYTRQCSIMVTTTQLAVMATTISNMGINPQTSEPVLDALAVRNTLSVMLSSGMYNYSGQWTVDVGVPAKSGVSGGVMACVNRQLGIAAYSPRLDERGNSVRGIAACVSLADELGLHTFDLSNRGSAMLELYLSEE
jgi:glutaminase